MRKARYFRNRKKLRGSEITSKTENLVPDSYAEKCEQEYQDLTECPCCVDRMIQINLSELEPPCDFCGDFCFDRWQCELESRWPEFSLDREVDSRDEWTIWFESYANSFYSWQRAFPEKFTEE